MSKDALVQRFQDLWGRNAVFGRDPSAEDLAAEARAWFKEMLAIARKYHCLSCDRNIALLDDLRAADLDLVSTPGPSHVCDVTFQPDGSIGCTRCSGNENPPSLISAGRLETERNDRKVPARSTGEVGSTVALDNHGTETAGVAPSSAEPTHVCDVSFQPDGSIGCTRCSGNKKPHS